MTDEEEQGGVGRWGVAALLLGLIVFCGYVGYDKWRVGQPDTAATQPAASASPTDARMFALLQAGYEQLEAGHLDAAVEQFQKASGVAEHHPEVHEALCVAKVVAVEGSFLRLRASVGDEASRDALLANLERDAERAQSNIQAARELKPAAVYLSRLNGLDRQINSWLALAYVGSGHGERARGAFQARLSSHPHAQLLNDFIKRAGPASPASSSSASANASASASVGGSPAAPALAATPPNGGGRWGERPYEFDHEPVVNDLGAPNELRVPATPTPAPPRDVSDLPPE